LRLPGRWQTQGCADLRKLIPTPLSAPDNRAAYQGLKDCRAHDKSKDKENHKSNYKDEEEYLSDPGSSGGDSREPEQAGDNRNDEEE
jgi:hypothetical protein